MRILLFTKLLTAGRFADLLLELTGRGFEVVVASPTQERDRAKPEALTGAGGVRFDRYDEFEDPASARAAELLRRSHDYVWYLAPEHRVASFNRKRALRRLVKAASAGTRSADPAWPDPVIPVEPAVQAQLEQMLAGLERQLPPDPGVVRFIAAHEPDAVLVSPLIRPSLHQAEVVKAAQSLGVPTGLPVYSWDSLSNKGCMHAAPDRVYAWNEIHRREAIELHGVDPSRVVVTGAPHWDPFFELTPSADRDAFCAQHRFDGDRPIVTYLGSTRTVCRNEPPVVEGWLAALRSSTGALRDANVLVRPHPGEADSPKWTEWTPPGARVSVSNRGLKADQSLFDELHHADVVVGLNTSAQIEASILGKPVYTFSAGELAEGQGGSLHFYYLLREQGGVVSYAETLDEHVRQLESGLAGEYDRDAIRRFCEQLVRPHGFDRPVVPILADEVEALARPAGVVPAAVSEAP